MRSEEAIDMQQRLVQKADGTLVHPVRPTIVMSDNRPINMNGIAFYEYGTKPQPDLRERIELAGEQLTDYGIITPWIPSIWYRHEGSAVQQTPQWNEVTGEDHYINLITEKARSLGANVVVETDKFGEKEYAKTSQVKFYRLKQDARPLVQRFDQRSKQEIFALGLEAHIGNRTVRIYGRDEIAPDLQGAPKQIEVCVDVHMDDALEAANPIIKEESAAWYNRQAYLAAALAKANELDATLLIERRYENRYTRFKFSSAGDSYIDYKIRGELDMYL